MTTPNDQLWDSIKDENEVKRLINLVGAERADANHKKVKDGGVLWLPIAYAVYWGYSGTVEQLLDVKGIDNKATIKDVKGVDEVIPIQYKGHNNWTLLAYCVYNHSVRRTRALLQNQINPNQKILGTNQALLEFALVNSGTGTAQKRAYLEVALLLIEFGANPKGIISIPGYYYSGWSYVACAVYWQRHSTRYTEVAIALLAKGASSDDQITLKGISQSLIKHALENGYNECIPALTAKDPLFHQKLSTLSRWQRWSSDFKQVVVAVPAAAEITLNPNAAANTLPQTGGQYGDVKLVPPVCAAGTDQSSNIKNDLSPVQREQFAKKLTIALFHALFADTLQADSTQESSVLYQLIQLTFSSWPELLKIVTKLDLEKTELKDSQQGKLFVEFARNSLFQTAAVQLKVLPKLMTNQDSQKRWQVLLEKDDKQRDLFKDKFDDMKKRYISLSNEKIALEYLIDKFSSDFNPNIDLLNKIKFNLKDYIAYLKPFLEKELINFKNFVLENFDKQQSDDLIKFIFDELQFVVNEKINDRDKPYINQLRIKLGIWQWLFIKQKLSDVQQQFYKLAKEISTQLLRLRGKSEDSKRKVSLEVMLILEVLLEHNNKYADQKENRILSHFIKKNAKQSSSFIAKASEIYRDNKIVHDELDIVEYVAKRKHDFETSSDEKTKDISYFGLAVNISNQLNYKFNIQRAINDWLAQITPCEYSTSRPSSNSTSKTDLPVQIVFSANQKNFINAFCHKFEKFYCMYSALDDGSVSRLQEAVDKFAKETVKHTQLKLNVMSNELPIGQFGLILAKLAVWRKDRQVQMASERIGFVFGTRSMEENSRFIRFAAEYIAYRYEMQLNRLSDKGNGIQFVGECAAERAVQYITSSDSHLALQEPSLLDRAWQAITRFMNYKKYDPDLVKEFKGPISLIIDGVIQGESEKDTAKSVSTSNGDSWIPGGIFRNVGFMVEDEKGEVSLYRHPKLVTISDVNRDSKEHGLLIYGYCKIKVEELDLALKHGFVKDEKASLDEVFKRFGKPVKQFVQQQTPSQNPMLPRNSP